MTSPPGRPPVSAYDALLDVVRDEFGRVAYTHKAHQKMIDRLSGRLLWERTVSLTKGSSRSVEYTLVPLVAEGWRDDDPVPYVVRVDNRNRYLAERATRNREPVLGHAEGGVAVPAAQEFLKMQVPVADARQLRLVPSENGAPAVRDSADADFTIYVVIAAGLSVFYVLIMLVIVAANANQRRRERKAALRQAAR